MKSIRINSFMFFPTFALDNVYSVAILIYLLLTITSSILLNVINLGYTNFYEMIHEEVNHFPKVEAYVP